MRISNYPTLIFDEFPLESNRNETYILSGPTNTNVEYKSDCGIIFVTTSKIKRVLMQLPTPIPEQIIHHIDKSACLADDLGSIRLRIINPNVSSGHVVYLIYRSANPNDMTLYINGLNELGTLFDDDFLRMAIEKKLIKTMYLDNYLQYSNISNTVEEASKEILKLIRENPGKRFHMEMNECGQEALLINLMQKHNIRMSLNLLRRTLLSVLNFDVEKWITSPANAIITVVKSNNTTSMDLKYNYNKKNQICIRFIESQMSIRNYFAEIKYIAFTQHPSKEMYEHIVKNINAVRVYKIYDDVMSYDDDDDDIDSHFLLHPEAYRFGEEENVEYDNTFLNRTIDLQTDGSNVENISNSNVGKSIIISSSGVVNPLNTLVFVSVEDNLPTQPEVPIQEPASKKAAKRKKSFDATEKTQNEPKNSNARKTIQIRRKKRVTRSSLSNQQTNLTDSNRGKSLSSIMNMEIPRRKQKKTEERIDENVQDESAAKNTSHRKESSTIAGPSGIKKKTITRTVPTATRVVYYSDSD